MPFPRIWDLLDEFKNGCRSRSWQVYDTGDLIEAENEYHRFFWIRVPHSGTFKKVIMNPFCTLCEGISYKTAKLSYIAWLLQETPSWNLWLYLILEAPRLSRKVALYDLSRAYQGASRCYKLNETGSVVFQEFELFLNDNYGITFTPLTSLRRSHQSEPSIREEFPKVPRIEPQTRNEAEMLSA